VKASAALLPPLRHPASAWGWETVTAGPHTGCAEKLKNASHAYRLTSQGTGRQWRTGGQCQTLRFRLRPSAV